MWAPPTTFCFSVSDDLAEGQHPHPPSAPHHNPHTSQSNPLPQHSPPPPHTTQTISEGAKPPPPHRHSSNLSVESPGPGNANSIIGETCGKHGEPPAPRCNQLGCTEGLGGAGPLPGETPANISIVRTRFSKSIGFKKNGSAFKSDRAHKP